MSTPYKVTAAFWDHATLWSDDESLAGHSTDGGRVFGVTRTRYAECDHYGCSAVVVIDPENRDDVARLVNLYEDRRPGNTRLLDHMTTALREFANPTPPKPAEPTGLGAVVEDAHFMWVRARISDGPADVPQWRSFPGGQWKHWADIDAVRVLAEGVTP